ncbi:alpha/beta fold hydrolase [Azotobacter chroococcum subsp. isscasi]|uniref:alpha/beta fold hydrolase n=1 Tax=Azotobacter chroococcum TaxID=353 RepID=UPI00103F00D9|nr:alpha/beta fold hydrolase [Azotobacter chroococcum]TBW12884.1 alpha/beta fold hydrolase [Azotobacter chroococcum subsp. isscasi]
MNAYGQLDQLRRLQGCWLETLGLGPQETPSRVVLSAPPFTLRAYGPADRAGPLLLLLPAPIKRAYIWDLTPAASVVRRLLRHGAGVYLLHWENPGVDGQELGLADYADRCILQCLDAIAAERGRRRIFLAGHSLGGSLAAIFAALHPERVGGLILLEAPIRFGAPADAFTPFVARAPHARQVTALLHEVPGSFLSMAAARAAPDSFVRARWSDWLHSLADREALQRHLQVIRWTLDELPFPRRLFEEVIELLYRENRFMTGTLQVRGRLATPARVKAPVLSVVDPRSHVVPPDAVLPFHAAVGSGDAQLLRYEGDVGVALQHVGVLVGKRAHREVWPRILHWLDAHGEAG